MIDYHISLLKLARLVDENLPTTRNQSGKQRKNGRLGWLTRAGKETKRLQSEGKYTEPQEGEFWRELKNIFATIQGDGKCAYCEQKLNRHKPNPITNQARVTGDIEHYRPKGGVEAWPNYYLISTGTDAPHHYHRLAFYLRNYLLSCEICNRDFKGNFFPIAGPLCPVDSSRVADLNAERPYLLHPLDPNEPDPELLIEFQGLNPVPRAMKNSDDYWRAIVTINLLGLTRGSRYILDFERAQVIALVHLALTATSSDAVAIFVLGNLDNDGEPHRNCARSFKRLYDTDPTMAGLIAAEALEFTKPKP